MKDLVLHLHQEGLSHVQQLLLLVPLVLYSSPLLSWLSRFVISFFLCLALFLSALSLFILSVVLPLYASILPVVAFSPPSLAYAVLSPQLPALFSFFSITPTFYHNF